MMKLNLSLVALLEIPRNTDLKLFFVNYGFLPNIEIVYTICTLCYKSWKIAYRGKAGENNLQLYLSFRL